MNSSVWLPPIIVLALGAIAGIWAALRMRKRKVHMAKDDADLRLEISDLEARRDALYKQIEDAEDNSLDAGEVDTLEIAAATALRDLDRARARFAAMTASTNETTREPAPPTAPRRGSAIGGFAAGIALSALVGVLVFWAVRDAKPDPMRERMEAERQSQTAAAEAGLPPHQAAPLPPMVAERVANLEAQLEADPESIQARKELALTLLAVEQYVPAFQEASKVLEKAPGDPDGLFIHGVVRVAMNQNDEAIALLDRVIGRFPQHVYAQMYKGIALARSGRPGDAKVTWQAGLQSAGGSHPELERLLAMADSGALSGAPGQGAPGQGAPGQGASTESAPAGETPATAGTADSALAWSAPAGWQAENPASPMRRAQYRVPGAAGDAELVVFYFGAGQGGDVMANARRWADQFTQADGRPSAEVMETRERSVGDIPVTLVEVEGTYSGGMSDASTLDDAMLLGAIARGPDANWFFKLTGPKATVEAQRTAFDDFIGSLRTGGAS